MAQRAQTTATTDLTVWLALRRANEGGVTLLDGSYYQHGRAVPHYLNTPFADLIDAGRLTLADADPDTAGMHKVTLTDAGRELYATLCGKRGVSPDPPCPDSADPYRESGTRITEPDLTAIDPCHAKRAGEACGAGQGQYLSQNGRVPDEH